jgi:hypothetical protein
VAFSRARGAICFFIVGLRFSSTLLMAALAVCILALDCASPGPCQLNSDCPIGYYCNQSKDRCVSNCVDATRDCDPGQYCDVNGHCQNSPDGSPPPDASPDVVQNETGPADVTSEPDVIIPPAAKIELDLCAIDSECKTGLLCRALYVGGPTRCTPTCTTSSQCRSGARCVTLGSDTYCADADVGRTCNTMTPGTCNYACVSPGYCTTQCTSGADCPNGYGCATVSSQKVCVRAEQFCGNGSTQACTSLDCDTSILASGCTLPCGSASDCPQRASVLTPWTCSTYCQRPSDVYGPLAQNDTASYACDGSNAEINLCNDAQHIDFATGTVPTPPTISCPVSTSVDGSAGDVCVDTCRYSGACAFGFACTGIGDISNTRVDLCMPAHGSGEVGSSCATDGDCAFGYCSASKCSRDCSADGICPTGSACTAVGGSYPNVEGIPFKRCQ